MVGHIRRLRPPRVSDHALHYLALDVNLTSISIIDSPTAGVVAIPLLERPPHVLRAEGCLLPRSIFLDVPVASATSDAIVAICVCAYGARRRLICRRTGWAVVS